MSFNTVSRRARAKGGIARPDNRSQNKSPYVSAVIPQPLFDALADEAHQRRVPVSQVIREALRARYAPTGRAAAAA